MKNVTLIMSFDGDIVFATEGSVDDAIAAFEKRFNSTCVRKDYKWWYCSFEEPLGVREGGEIVGGSEDTSDFVITTFPLDIFQHDFETVE